MGYKKYTPVEVINRSKSKLEPSITFGDSRRIIFSKSDGAIDTDAAIEELTKRFSMYGGKISYPCEYLASNIKMGSYFLLIPLLRN
ncbi:MAG: hypothetical protein CM15mP22_7850 [Gammaproteobacteria bacterium]|nr:MAG: hypothetical protein CM15mP22_7850 [Gammaproteobacteria bacterium]